MAPQVCLRRVVVLHHFGDSHRHELRRCRLQFEQALTQKFAPMEHLVRIDGMMTCDHPLDLITDRTVREQIPAQAIESLAGVGSPNGWSRLRASLHFRSA